MSRMQILVPTYHVSASLAYRLTTLLLRGLEFEEMDVV
jgi:hypothetical protein